MKAPDPTAGRARGMVIATLVMISCGGGGSGATTPRPGSDPGRGRGDVGADPDGAALGVLALVPVEAGAPARPGWEWLPASSDELRAGVVVSEPDPASADAGPALAAATAIGAGGVSPATPAGQATVGYGCDGGTHRFVRWRTDRAVGDGIVWLRPPGPAADATRAVAIEAGASQRERTATLRLDPPVAVTLTASGPGQARLVLRRGATVALTREVERAVMDGDAPGALDLRERVPGLPSLLAAFTTERPGQVLLVFGTPGYEGDSISAMFLDQRGAVDADLGFYLYQCAY